MWWKTAGVDKPRDVDKQIHVWLKYSLGIAHNVGPEEGRLALESYIARQPQSVQDQALKRFKAELSMWNNRPGGNPGGSIPK